MALKIKESLEIGSSYVVRINKLISQTINSNKFSIEYLIILALCPTILNLVHTYIVCHKRVADCCFFFFKSEVPNSVREYNAVNRWEFKKI